MPSRVAEILLEAARQQGEGIRERGRIWGGMAEQLGQIPGQAVAQQQQRQLMQSRLATAEQQRQIGSEHLRNLQQERMDADLWGRAVSQNTSTDPTTGHLVFNHAAIAQQIAGRPKLLENWMNFSDQIQEHDEKNQQRFLALEQGKNTMRTDFLDGVLNAPEEQRPQIYAMRMGALSGVMKDDPVLKQLPPVYDENAVKGVHESLLTSKQRLDRQKEAAEIAAKNRVKVGEGEKIYDFGAPGTAPTIVAEGAPKRNAEADKERRRNIEADRLLGKPISKEDAAWAKGYDVVATEPGALAAAAATERQTRTIGAQIGMEGLREKNRRQEVGLKELTDKVELPYQSALAQAQTLRDTVAAARSGNKIAASMQSLETAMAAIRAQGLNRINTVEIGMPASAGNTWDHIVGWFGQRVEGQPIPANIQKDMEEFATVLEKGARQKYEQAHKSITKRYELNETLVPPPAPSAASGPPAATAGRTRVVGPNGQTGTVPDGTALPPGWKKQ